MGELTVWCDIEDCKYNFEGRCCEWNVHVGHNKCCETYTPNDSKRRVVYRGDVFNALESARIIALDGILTDRYKDGFHDGLKRALEILANDVQDVPIIQSEEG